MILLTNRSSNLKKNPTHFFHFISGFALERRIRNIFMIKKLDSRHFQDWGFPWAATAAHELPLFRKLWQETVKHFYPTFYIWFVLLMTLMWYLRNSILVKLMETSSIKTTICMFIKTRENSLWRRQRWFTVPTLLVLLLLPERRIIIILGE